MAWRRHNSNPILTREAIPDMPPHLSDASSVFNPGATRFDGRTLLLLRVQSRGRESFLVRADSDDGVRFSCADRPLKIVAGEASLPEAHHIYDPRITLLDERYRVLLAVDLDDGCYLGLAETDDFRQLHWRGIVSEAGVRNGVLFPQKIGGRFVRLERPNNIVTPGIAASGTSIVVSSSDDLLQWKREGVLAGGRPHYWDELIGSGPPPILTDAGWLHVYHGVATHFGGLNIYQAGVMLLDANDPTRLLARSRNNCLEPRESYELIGQVPNVVFPSGWTVNDVDEHGRVPAHALVHLYYGAADSCVALATTTIADLLAMCED